MSPAFKLRSPETGTEYWIYVRVPAPLSKTSSGIRPPASGARPSGSGPWPAVLFMDGDNQFASAVRAYGAERAAGRVPPLLLVGVGYGASYGRAANKRGRDYTPTHHSFEPASGGGSTFLKFLIRTLWPELARRYPVDPKTRGLAGYSLGALLVLHALFQKRPFFTHHLAAAPSIWWDDRAILAQARRRRARQSALPARLFLGVGEKDSDSMTADLALLETQLAARPFAKLAVTSRRFPRRTHYTALPASFRTGLTALFGRTRNASR